jgi:DNA-binding LytR/AlgR family response regulator
VAAVYGSKVLIVEDEFFIANGLARYFTELGAEVLGPAPSMESARRFLVDAEAAILDIQVSDGPVFSLADDLADRRVPFVFYSGHNEISIPERFRHVGYLSKPLEYRAVSDALILARPRARAPAGALENVLDVLPHLRLTARLYLGDVTAADRLVEITLEDALTDIRSKPLMMPLDTWLGRLMQDAFERQGTRLMN